MAPLIQSSLAQKGAIVDGAESRRFALPNYHDNPLIANGADNPSVEAYKSLRTQVMKAHFTRDVVSVVVTSAGHSDGKTLTTFNLACACAQLQDLPVLLVDADLRTQGLTRFIGDLPPAGLADFLSGTVSCEDIAVRTNLGDLWVIGAGTTAGMSPAELFSTERWLQFMMWARKRYKLVLVDSLPISVVADFELIAGACDGVVVVVRTLKTHREELEEAFAQLDTSKVVGVVWNGSLKTQKYYGQGR